MTLWLDPPSHEISPELLAVAGGNVLVARLLARRGYADPAAARAFLNPDFYEPAPPGEMPGMDSAVELLEAALTGGERILVWGDFDVDGQTSTALLVSGLAALGGRVEYYIPVRASESHGISAAVLQEKLKGDYTLLLTCDTGIAAHEALTLAKRQGLKVIITDHHDLPPDLPPADAIINPKLLPARHSLSSLPGVGVAYKLVEALFTGRGRQAELEQYLDLVALGIVADVAEQRGEARYLLQRGLRTMRSTRRPGLLALMEFAQVNPATVNEEQIGFLLAPRLNALGRLADANLAPELFTSRDSGRARLLALELEGLNSQRKLLTEQVYDAALGQIERDPALLNFAALVLQHEQWEGGVIGIVASRLVERFLKPVVLIATPPGKPGRASARSVAGIDIHAALASCAELLIGFGGHPGAAGFAIDPLNIPALRVRLSGAVMAQYGGEAPVAALAVDAWVGLHEINPEFALEIERLAPFGEGNPAPLFATRGLGLHSRQAVGRSGEHVRLSVQDENGKQQKVIWWRGANEEAPQGRFDLAFHLRSSDYLGERQITLEWVAARALPEAAPAAHPEMEIIDYRAETDPLALLKTCREAPGVLVWAEGEERQRVNGLDRTQLGPAETLVVWSIPPGDDELRAALAASGAKRVILFAVDGEASEVEPFMRRLAGVCRFIIHEREGQTDLATLAAAASAGEPAVRLGLAWLDANRKLGADVKASGVVALQKPAGDPPDKEKAAGALKRLQSALAESAAYRQYYRRARSENLVLGM